MYHFCQGMGYSSGVTISAISGIETALLDLFGKHYHIPLYKILGGKYRDKVRLYADCHTGEGEREIVQTYGNHVVKGIFEPEAFARKAKRVKEEGYSALKFDIDLPEIYDPDPYNRCLSNEELKLIENLVSSSRDAVGDYVDLAFDCHWKYNVNDAIKLARRLEPYNIIWLEDPIPFENIQSMKKLSSSTKVPLCTGENLFTRYGFRELLEEDVIEI